MLICYDRVVALRTAFREVDSDGNGELDATELLALLRKVTLTFVSVNHKRRHVHIH